MSWETNGKHDTMTVESAQKRLAELEESYVWLSNVYPVLGHPLCQLINTNSIHHREGFGVHA